MSRIPALLATVGLLLAAGCGSDDAASSATTTAADSAATTVPVADDTAVSTSESTDDSTATTEATAGGTADTTADAGATDAFPISITHKYGETTIPAEPVRVVSVGYSEQDAILALGVVPVGIRDWYGDQPYAVWPWAQDELGDAQPTVLDSASIDFEAVAALQPDLILGVTSGMTEAEYDTLSKIAPTIAQPGDYIDYGTPWDVATQLIGDSLGRSELATSVIAGVQAQFAAARAAHPEFEGATAGVDFFYDDMPGSYSSSDPRSRMLTDLGFTIPAKFDELAGDAFFFSISQEDLDVLDTDVVLWIVGSDSEIAAVGDMALRPTMRAYAEGREVVTDTLLSGAFSFASPLSLGYVLDRLVPELALAVDGDPATAVPSAAQLDAG